MAHTLLHQGVEPHLLNLGVNVPSGFRRPFCQPCSGTLAAPLSQELWGLPLLSFPFTRPNFVFSPLFSVLLFLESLSPPLPITPCRWGGGPPRIVGTHLHKPPSGVFKVTFRKQCIYCSVHVFLNQLIWTTRAAVFELLSFYDVSHKMFECHGPNRILLKPCGFQWTVQKHVEF